MADAPFTKEELALPGVLLITPTVYEDHRGSAMNAYDREAFLALGVRSNFAQDFVSVSKRNVIRGLHYQQAPHAQDKLVRCTRGSILDVVVDFDPSSPTYRKHVAVPLRGDRPCMLFIPGRYAHGYAVTSDEAVLEYKLSDAYHAEAAGGFRFDDPAFGIEWPVTDPILSMKDASWPPHPFS